MLDPQLAADAYRSVMGWWKALEATNIARPKRPRVT